MKPARCLPAALLLLLIWGGGGVAFWAAGWVGATVAILAYWAYLLILAVWLLGLGMCMPQRARQWWRRACGDE